MQRGSEAVHHYHRILSYGRVDEYVGDSEAGLLHLKPLLDGALLEISVDHTIGGHPLMGLTASLVAKGMFVIKTSTEQRSAAFVIRFRSTDTQWILSIHAGLSFFRAFGS